MPGSRLKLLKYTVLVLVTFAASLFVELTFYTKWPGYFGGLCTDDEQDQEQQFLNDWCRLENWRFDWEGFLAPCNKQLAWYQRQINSAQRSDANRSFIKKWSLKPAGMNNLNIVFL